MTEPFTPGSWNPPPRRGPALIALAVIAAVLFATTATFLTLWLVERSDSGETSREAAPPSSSLTTTAPDPAEALEAGKRLAVLVTSYDYRTIEENTADVLYNSTGEFAEQYKGASNSLRELVTDAKAVASGKVLKIAAAESEPERAVLLAFVDQNVKNAEAPSGRSDKNRMVLTLVKQQGRWLIEKLELV